MSKRLKRNRIYKDKSFEKIIVRDWSELKDWFPPIEPSNLQSITDSMTEEQAERFKTYLKERFDDECS